MKKQILLLLLLSFFATTFAQVGGSKWQNIVGRDNAGATGAEDRTVKVLHIDSLENSTVVRMEIPGFYLNEVNTPKGIANTITIPKSANTASAGDPDLPMIGVSVIVDDHGKMAIRIIDAEYVDFDSIEVAPSKGDFPRSTDPATVPYHYGDPYMHDTFFPGKTVELGKPYIIRDFRGQNIAFHPFLYNAVSKTLRVYYRMTVEVYKTDDKGINELFRSNNDRQKISPDFESLYRRRFINYNQVEKNVTNAAKYTPVEESGDLLVICHDAFIEAMNDFVAWKKTRGVHTTIVGTSAAGNSYTSIKNYIQSRYAENNNLTYVLLVGDVEHIPGHPYQCGLTIFNGLGDNPYGQIMGDDVYNDLFVGRFPAQTAEQVALQAEKVIRYELGLDTTDSWCQNGMGVCAEYNATGHYNESEWQHMDHIRTDMLGYGYNTVYQEYYGVQGFSSTTNQLCQRINSGVGIINYCGHGSTTAWLSHSPSVSNNTVNNLTNVNKLPLIFSAACLNGKYDETSGDCFAEAWMHATDNNTGMPTGAVATVMSYINQPWTPPMYAQDEFVDILVESYDNNIKHTIGGVVGNALMSMFVNFDDINIPLAIGTYQSWILFGDPTLTLRTKTPRQVAIAHSPNIVIESPSLTVAATSSDGATASLTDQNHDIIGTATVVNGIATIDIPEPIAAGTELTLCFSGYNKVTQIDTVTVVNGNLRNIAYGNSQHGAVSGPANAYSGSTVTLTVTPQEGYHLAAWSISDAAGNSVTVIDGIGPASPGNHFVMPDGDITVNATFAANGSVILEPVVGGVIDASPMSSTPGTTVNLFATPDYGYALGEWSVRRSDDTAAYLEVNNNSFIMPEVDALVSASFLPAHRVNIATVTNGSISADHGHALDGETVSLSAIPDSNYVLDRWFVYRTDDIDTEIEVSGDSFIMPDFDVTVAALFRQGQTQNDTVSDTTQRYSLYIPLYATSAYSISQQIYTADEAGDAGLISAISFLTNFSNLTSDTRDITVFLSNSTKDGFANGNDWVSQSNDDQYYSGPYTFQIPGWNTILLERPFVYDGTSNILVTVVDNTGSYTSIIEFITHQTDRNRVIYKNSSSQAFNPETMTVTGELSLSVNNIIFHRSTDTGAHLSLSFDSLSDFHYPFGQGPSLPQSVGIIGSNISGSLFISVPDHYEVSNAAEGIYSSSLQIEPSGGNVREMVFFRLRDNLAEGAYLQHATLEADNLRDTITLVGYVGNANAITTIDNQPFACFSRNNIVINGIGNLQIIDILGRIVARYTLRNTPTHIQNSSFPSPGVYILRLCGDTTKTQKVVVVR